MTKINTAFVSKVLSVVDKGLVCGLGVQVPGKMCVEAAVAFAAGEDHNDKPECVDDSVSNIKITLNDDGSWKSTKSRARGLRRVAIAQLGSAGRMKWMTFSTGIMNFITPIVMSAVPKFKTPQEAYSWFGGVADYFDTIERGSEGGDYDLGMSIANLYGFIYPEMEGKEKAWAFAAEAIVQGLKANKIPGTKYLYLTEKKKKVTKRKAKSAKKRL